MKRPLILLSMLFLVSPTLFAATAPAASSPALPALAAPGETPIFLSSCQASVDCRCGDGVIPISCTGSVSCTVQAGSVTCDGHRLSCTSVDCNPPAGGGDLLSTGAGRNGS
jgi:hypothetical protein